jgi:hypothetical protein
MLCSGNTHGSIAIGLILGILVSIAASPFSDQWGSFQLIILSERTGQNFNQL